MSTTDKHGKNVTPHVQTLPTKHMYGYIYIYRHMQMYLSLSHTHTHTHITHAQKYVCKHNVYEAAKHIF